MLKYHSKEKKNGKFQFIQYYLPSWKESNPNYDDAFKKALDCTTEILIIVIQL